MRGDNRRRWPTASLFVAALLLARAATAAPVEFDVAAGAATETLASFARQAGVALAFPYDLAVGRRTRAVRGRLEPDAALEAMLRDSGLAAHRDDNGALVIAAAPATVQRSRQRDAPAATPPGPASPLAEVVVTGSRLDVSNMASVTPVTAVNSADLELFGPGPLVEALARLPHFLNNDTPESQSFGSSAAAGASHLNLRGIGSIRTLTLVDGRRIVPSTRFGTIDLALLPRSLVRRVEVVTGGASAAYGSDAISGVANVLLDSNFTGLRITAQGGITQQGDNSSGSFDTLFGTQLGADTHLLLAAELMRTNGIRGYDSRPWFSSRAAITNPDAAGPREITVDDAHSTGYTYGGLITSGPLAGTKFLPGGVTAPFVAGQYRTSLTQAGGDGEDPARDIIWILPTQARANGFARLATGFTPDLRGFVQLLGSVSENEFGKDPPSLWGPWEATIYADNAFLPADVLARMRTAGVDSFKLGRVAAEDLGRGRIVNSSKLLSATLGFDWQLNGWRLDGYYQYGRNRNEITYLDAMRIDLMYRALDSVVDSGRIVCRSTLTFPDDGCVPLNLFGVGAPSAAARDYVTAGRLTQVQDVEEHVAELALQGDALQLPAGPLRVAGGLNWRNEAARNHPERYPAELEDVTIRPAGEQGYKGLPAAYLTGQTIFERAVESRVSGSYAVQEVFAEAALPLYANAAQDRGLSMNGALRYANYTGSGTVTAWKFGADWQLHEALRLRATRSRDVRAGSLAERLDVGSSGITIRDPFLPGAPSYAVVAVRAPNPLVEPEKGDTLTAGFVFQPSWRLPFALSADYFDIRIKDAISTVGVQNIIDRCYAGTSPELCPLILRTADTGFINRVNNQVLNLAQARSRGVDVEAYWRSPLQILGGTESIAIRLLGNYSLESSTTTESGVHLDRVGQTGLVGGSPRWQANLSVAYRRDNLQVALQQQLISAGIYSAMNVLNGPDSIDDNTVGGVAYTNLRAEWRPEALTGLTLFAHVANLFDRAPPAVPDWGFAGSIPTNESLFDPIGRRFNVGIQLDL